MLSERFDQWEREFLEKGRQKGQQESLHKLLARLVEKRFGELPEQVRERLRSASLEQLESWTECLMDAASLDEVVGCVQPTRADS